jgi:hypothetical protein
VGRLYANLHGALRGPGSVAVERHSVRLESDAVVVAALLQLDSSVGQSATVIPEVQVVSIVTERALDEL